MQAWGALLVVVMVHELGHALAGWLSGHRVLGVFIGSGPRVLAFQIGRVAVQLRALPFGGAVAAVLAQASGWTRAREAALYAGGPVANLLVFAASRAVAPAGPWFDGPGWWDTVALLNLIFGVMNLLPLHTPQGVPFDGRRLAAIPFWSRGQVDEASASAGLVQVLDTVDDGDLPAATVLADRLQARYPHHGAAVSARGLALHRAGQHQAARARLLQDLAQAPEAAKPLVRNALAYVDVALDGPAARP